MGKNKTILSTLALSTLVSAIGPIGYGVGNSLIKDYYTYPKYAYDYKVKDIHTGDQKSQSEIRNGGIVKGQYSLVEPDGSVRIVNYQADPYSGFNAVVKKVGATLHPAPNYYHKSLPLSAVPISPYDNGLKLNLIGAGAGLEPLGLYGINGIY